MVSHPSQVSVRKLVLEDGLAGVDGASRHSKRRKAMWFGVSHGGSGMFCFLSALSLFGVRRARKLALHDRAADFREGFLFIDF